MSRSLAAALLLAAIAVCTAASGQPRAVRLVTRPETLVVGQRWTARLTVRPAGTPVLVATAGPRKVRARMRAISPGRYAATVHRPRP